MDDFQDKYVQAMFRTGEYLETIDVAKPDETKLQVALDRAYKTRDFEIELYWKRATYFWAFQAIAFTVAGFLFKDGALSRQNWPMLIPAGLGAITAYAGYLTALGSKFWQKNWEAHVGLLEEISGIRSTLVVLSDGPPSFSVSRVNQRLMAGLVGFWIVVGLVVLFTESLIHYNYKFLPFNTGENILIAALSLLVFFIFGLCMYERTRTRLNGWQFTKGESDWLGIPEGSNLSRSEGYKITLQNPHGIKREKPKPLP